MQIRRLVAAASRGGGGGGGEGRRHSSEQASALLLLAFIEFSESRAHTGREQTRYFPRLGQADRPIRKAFQLVGPFARSRSRNNFHSRIALSASLSFRSTRPESCWTSSARYDLSSMRFLSIFFVFLIQEKFLGKDRERDIFIFFDILEICSIVVF